MCGICRIFLLDFGACLHDEYPNPCDMAFPSSNLLCMLRPAKALYGPSLGALEDFLCQAGPEQLQKHHLRSIMSW